MAEPTSDGLMERRAMALASANRIRTSRAQFKARLKTAESKRLKADMVIALIAFRRPWSDTWKLAEVLDMIPQWGRRRISNMMKVWGFAPGKQLQDLTLRQRHMVNLEIDCFARRNGW